MSCARMTTRVKAGEVIFLDKAQFQRPKPLDSEIDAGVAF